MASDKDTYEYDNSISQAINDHGIYVFMDSVDEASIKPVIEWIIYENHVRVKKRTELILMICSDGGNMADAFALIDVMRSSKVPIKTVGLGSIASAGLMIFIAGNHRVLTPNTSVMSHQFSWGTEGKVHELFATLKEFELTHERMIKHYRTCTKLTDAVIRKVLLPPQDVYLSSKEALKYHICDEVAEV